MPMPSQDRTGSLAKRTPWHATSSPASSVSSAASGVCHPQPLAARILPSSHSSPIAAGTAPQPSCCPPTLAYESASSRHESISNRTLLQIKTNSEGQKKQNKVVTLQQTCCRHTTAIRFLSSPFHDLTLIAIPNVRKLWQEAHFG